MNFEKGGFYRATHKSDVVMNVVAVVQELSERITLRVRWINIAGEKPTPVPVGEQVVNVKPEHFDWYERISIGEPEMALPGREDENEET